MKAQGFKYVHLGAIKLGLGPLVRPYLPISSLCVAIDTRHRTFADAIIGGFTAPLHDGPAFGTIYPKYSVSLEDPYIYDLLKAYILPKGFNMDTGSKIIQLKGAVVARFGNDTLPPLRSHVHQSSHLHSVVESEKSKQSTPVTFDWTGINYPMQWEVKYKELRNTERLANSFTAQPLTFDRSTSSFRVPDELPTRRFTPPLIRSTSSASYNNSRHQAEINSVSTSSLQPSFSG